MIEGITESAQNLNYASSQPAFTFSSEELSCLPLGAKLPATVVRGEQCGLNIAGTFIAIDLPEGFQAGDSVELRMIANAEAVIVKLNPDSAGNIETNISPQVQTILNILGLNDESKEALFKLLAGYVEKSPENILDELTLADSKVLAKKITEMATSKFLQELGVDENKLDINNQEKTTNSFKALPRLEAILQIIDRENAGNVSSALKDVMLQQSQILCELCEKLPILVGNGPNIDSFQILKDILNIQLKPNETAVKTLFNNIKDELFGSSDKPSLEALIKSLQEVQTFRENADFKMRPLLRMVETRIQLTMMEPIYQDEISEVLEKLPNLKNPKAQDVVNQILNVLPQGVLINDFKAENVINGVKQDLVQQLLSTLNLFKRTPLQERDFQSIEKLLQSGVSELTRPLEDVLERFAKELIHDGSLKQRKDIKKFMSQIVERETSAINNILNPQISEHITENMQGAEVLKSLAPLANAVNEPSLLIFSLLLGGFASNLEIIQYPSYQTESKEGEENEEKKEKSFTKLALRFELSHLGRIEVYIKYRDKEVGMKIALREENKIKPLEKFLPLLHKRLSELGYEEIGLSLEKSAEADIRPGWVQDIFKARDMVFA